MMAALLFWSRLGIEQLECFSAFKLCFGRESTERVHKRRKRIIEDALKKPRTICTDDEPQR